MMNTLPTPSAAQNEFENKILERLRNDIRELLPEDTLRQLVARAIDQTFFQERRIDRGYHNVEIKPSWFIEEIAKRAEPMIREQVDRFMLERKDLIEKVVADFLKEERLAVEFGTRMARNIDETFQRLIDRISQGRGY